MRRSFLYVLFPVLTVLFTISLHAGRVVLIAGGGKQTNGPATNCFLHAPFAIDFDAAGNMYIAEMAGGERVLMVDRAGRLSGVAGTGEKGNGGDGGPAIQAQFNGMHSLAIGPSQEIFIADTWNNRVRRIDANGMIVPFAGTGKKGFSGDLGTAAKAQFGGVFCTAFSSDRTTLYLTDLDNRRIRAVDMKTGMVKTVAGNGEKGIPADGAEANQSPLVDPRAAAPDAQGNLYVLERSGHALRMVDRNGKIRTVAGNGIKGFAGDDGDALKASFNGPKHLCLDGQNQVVIADTENHVIRKYLPKEQKVVRLAGSGKKGAGGVGGPPSGLELNQPHGVLVNRAGVLYIADSMNHRVLRIDP